MSSLRSSSATERELVARPVRRLGALVRRFPALVLVAALAVTAVLAVFAAQATVATNADGMAPDTPEIHAAETLAERFASEEEDLVQLLVTGESGSLGGSDALAAAAAIEQAVRSSDAGQHLADRDGRPAVVSWLAPAQAGLEGHESTPVDDDLVVETYEAALAQLPAEQAGLFTALLPSGTDLDGADRALMLVFLDVSQLSDDDLQAAWDERAVIDTSLADAVADVDLPAGLEVEAVSMPLLFAGLDDFDAELGRLFSTAFVIIVAILAFVYWTKPELGMRRRQAGRRSAADVLLSMTAIGMAIAWMQGVAALLGPGRLGVIGPMSQFAQVIPVLLIGLGVDYAIHLTSRYREEVGGGRGVAASVQGAVASVGAALVLATVTTALGFLTNVLNPIPDLRDFGILAAVGIVAAFVLMLTFVPAGRLLLDRRAERLGRLPAQSLGGSSKRLLPDLMALTAVLARRAPVATLAGTAVLAGLGVVALGQLETRYSDTDMIPEDSPVLATMEELAEHFDGGFAETTEVLLTGQPATAAAHNALVEVHGALADVDDVARRGDQVAAHSPVTLLAQLLRDRTDGAPIAPKVAAAAAEAGMHADLTVPAHADVTGVYEAMRVADPAAAAQVLATDHDGTPTHARLTLQTTAGEERSTALAADLDDVLAPVEAAGLVAVATSQAIVMDVIVEELQDSQVSSLAVTLLVATALLMAVFGYERRRPLLGVITIVPVALVVIWTFGAMAVTGIPFGPITATIAALAIGIGLPYAIHVTARFLEDRARHEDVGAAITATVRHTGGAMAGSAFTTMAGFGVLVTSSLLPFRQLGLVTVYAVGFALLAATLVLPSLLVLWDRWHRRRTAVAAEYTDDEQPQPALV
jgi:uncharacterized protein